MKNLVSNELIIYTSVLVYVGVILAWMFHKVPEEDPGAHLYKIANGWFTRLFSKVNFAIWIVGALLVLVNYGTAALDFFLAFVNFTPLADALNPGLVPYACGIAVLLLVTYKHLFGEMGFAHEESKNYRLGLYELLYADFYAATTMLVLFGIIGIFEMHLKLFAN